MDRYLVFKLRPPVLVPLLTVRLVVGVRRWVDLETRKIRSAAIEHREDRESQTFETIPRLHSIFVVRVFYSFPVTHHVPDVREKGVAYFLLCHRFGQRISFSVSYI